MNVSFEAAATIVGRIDEPFYYVALGLLGLIFTEAALATAWSNIRHYGRPWRIAPGLKEQSRLDWAITWVFASIVTVAAYAA